VGLLLGGALTEPRSFDGDHRDQLPPILLYRLYQHTCSRGPVQVRRLFAPPST